MAKRRKLFPRETSSQNPDLKPLFEAISATLNVDFQERADWYSSKVASP